MINRGMTIDAAMTFTQDAAGGDQVARTERIYDGLGWLTREQQQITGALTKEVGDTYDKGGNVTALYYPGGDVTISHTVTAAIRPT